MRRQTKPPGETVRLRTVVHPTRGVQIGVMCRKLPRFEEELRRSIPGSHRWWDAELQIWFVDFNEEKNLGIACHKYFDEVVWDSNILRGFKTPPPPQPKPPPPRQPPPPKQPPPRRSNFESNFESWAETLFGRGYTPPPPPPPRPSAGKDFFSRKHTTSEDYEVLQVSPRACPEVIKAAHRALSLKYHPDRGGDAAKLAAVNVAWERISK